MSLSAQILFSAVAHESSSGDLSSQMRVTPANYAVSLSDGTGASQSQVAWSDSYSWSDGTVVPYLVYGLSDDRGTTAFSAIKVLYVRNRGSDPILIGASNFSSGPIRSGGKVEVQGGGIAALVAPTAAGWSVGGSSSITIDRQAEGANADFDIVLIGEGAIS